MVYLDYSATTKTNEEVFTSFCECSKKFFANPNSMHKLGTEAKKLIDASTRQIASILGVKESEIIYTSGATESNNMAIKSCAYTFKNRGKHIITTDYEHSSVYASLSFLKNNGYEIEIIKTNEKGLINIDELEKIIRDDTVLVTIASVNSETGLRQPVEEIGKMIKKHPKCIFHVDATQSIGKERIDFSNIDLASFSAHKFYGLKGVGVLIKKEKINLEPLIHGGKSTTNFRAGTPPLGLIVSTAKALRLAYEEIDKKYKLVKQINDYIRDNIIQNDHVIINSNENCIPHIINISVLGIKPETMQHALEEHDIYISTKTACSKGDYSRSVYALTDSMERANSSIRVSLSHLTTREEINYFLDKFEVCFEQLIKLEK